LARRPPRQWHPRRLGLEEEDQLNAKNWEEAEGAAAGSSPEFPGGPAGRRRTTRRRPRARNVRGRRRGRGDALREGGDGRHGKNRIEPVSCVMGGKGGYPLRHSMDLVELGARSIDLVDLEFLEPGCLAGKNGVELFFFIQSRVELSQTRPKSPRNPLLHWSWALSVLPISSSACVYYPSFPFHPVHASIIRRTSPPVICNGAFHLVACFTSKQLESNSWGRVE
jgi:hypothetical protein